MEIEGIPFIRRAYKVYHVVYGDEKGGEINKGKEKSFGFPSFEVLTLNFEKRHHRRRELLAHLIPHHHHLCHVLVQDTSSQSFFLAGIPECLLGVRRRVGALLPLFLPGAGVLLRATGGGGAFRGRGGAARGRGGTAGGRGGAYAAGGDAHAADGVAHTAGRDDDSASSGSWSGMSGRMTSAINNYVVMVEEGLEDSEDALQTTQILVRSTGWPSCGSTAPLPSSGECCWMRQPRTATSSPPCRTSWTMEQRRTPGLAESSSTWRPHFTSMCRICSGRPRGFPFERTDKKVFGG